MFYRLVEGAPFSYVVVLLGLGATVAAVLQLIRTSRDIRGLVFGMLAALLATCGAGVGYGLKFLTGIAGADASSQATLVARAVTSGIAVSQLGGCVGVLASLFVMGAALRMSQRRIETAARGACFAGAFATLAAFASRLVDLTSVIIEVDGPSRLSVATVGFGEAASVLLLGFGGCAVVALTGGAASAIADRDRV